MKNKKRTVDPITIIAIVGALSSFTTLVWRLLQFWSLGKKRKHQAQNLRTIKEGILRFIGTIIILSIIITLLYLLGLGILTLLGR